MFNTQHSKRPETDQAQTTPIQKAANAKQDRTQQPGDLTRIPAYAQAWGNQPPPWLRLPVHQKESYEKEALPEKDEPPTHRKENTTGLPDTLKAGVENLSDLSLDDVQVHYNSAKPAQVQALAYTQGTEIHVGPGQEQHLAHEAWHVVQQKQGRVKPILQTKNVAVNDDEQLEREADIMGAKAVGLNQDSSHSLVKNDGARSSNGGMGGQLGLSTPLLQRVLNADTVGTHKPGRLPDAELTLNGFITNNGHTPENYTQVVYNSMQTQHAKVTKADDDVGKASKGSTQKRRERVKILKGLYQTLLDEANRENIDRNSSNWNNAVQAGAERYAALPVAQQTNTDAAYQQIGGQFWPGRNATPEDFWKAIRREARTQYAAAAVTADELAIRGIIQSANARFQTFRGNPLLNRGAWAGSNSYGVKPGDYAPTPDINIQRLQNKQIRMGGNLGSWWIMQSNEATTGWALHRGAVDDRGDFIYHL